MNSSCVNVNENLVLLFFILGCLLTIIGILLNLCSCLLFYRTKSLDKTPYGIFIIALSIADIIKLIAEYIVHILYFYIDHRYLVCSITWFLTLSSENLSYLFLCALGRDFHSVFFSIVEGIERNLKVWITNRRCLITRRRACIITVFLVIFVIIYDHPFLFLPYDVSYCFVTYLNHSILFSCDNAYYKSYGYSYSLTDLIFIETIGLNNAILPVLIISTNIILIFGLQRRAYQRRHRLGTRKTNDWREQSVILYVFISSITFILLTAPTGILNAWSAVYNQKMATNNLALILELMEILHHCSHFPILLMTSSVIRKKTFKILFHSRQSEQISFNSRLSSQLHIQKRSLSH
ncbi:unnamed protein product [Adineta steineri]|uniref:G-protein coupled receptors family 1 profile domain-containing protein n=1 Tax=Adineta steineri TaxID=433720 RepID=A0A815U7X9_9BILA|nr:unnamed protein product [Adineta steineri]CAF1648133.1 unnamed protein product [Adineta steineri]